MSFFESKVPKVAPYSANRSGNVERANLVMGRRTEGYLVNGKDAKEVDDLADHYQWMVGRARMRVSAADADDVANKALYDAHHPTGNRPPASEVPRVKLWLDELIDLRARAHRKNTNKREAEVLSDKAHSLVPNSPDTDVEMQYADREWIRIALESLPKDRRELIVQCYIEEIPIEEVARSLGEKTNTIHTRLRRIRADLRMKLDQLLRVSRRGLRIIFPFLFLRWLWKRTSGRVLDACARKIRRTVDGVFVAPGPLVWSAIAVAFVLGFDPSDPHAEASEQAEIRPDVQVAYDVVQLVHRKEVTPGDDEATPLKQQAALVPAPIVSPKRLASIDEQGNQLGMLLEAKAALNKRNYAKALALVNAHEVQYPNSQHAGKRETIRTIAMKAMASKAN